MAVPGQDRGLLGPGREYCHRTATHRRLPGRRPVTTATIISDEVRSADADIVGDRLTVEPGRLVDAMGWELKAQGLCRDDACVPVRDPASLFVGDRLDVAAVAAAL